MNSTTEAPRTAPPARRPGWIAAGVAAGALAVGAVVIASTGGTGSTSAEGQPTGAAGVVEGAAPANGTCIYDVYVFYGEDAGRLTTPIGGFTIDGAALSPVTDGGLCGYVAASALDTGGIVRSEQFAITQASFDDEGSELTLRIDHPSGVAAHGTLAGEPTANGALSFSGMLLDVDNDVPSVEISGLVLDPEVA
ncbi:MAG: hypothetical protein AAFY28_17275 [Actinomycetota bacterium]